MKTLVVSDTRYTNTDIEQLVGVAAKSFERTESGFSYYFDDSVSSQAIQSAQALVNSGGGLYEFRGVRVRNSVDVDNVVSAHIKEAIAPGRPANLQGEAEKALLAKVVAAMVTGDTAYVTEKMTFYATVVQPIRDEGNAFITARGW